MKKLILILLLFTGFLQAQILQNPTYGTLKLKNNIEASSSTKLSTQEADGSINWIQPINVPIPFTPTNYTISNQTIGQHLTGIDTRLGQISTTTAGITQRVYFTADNTTVNAVTYFASSLTGKGSTATGSPPALVLADNTKAYFTKDVISIAQPSATIAYGGTYSGNLTVSATPTPVATQQRFTVEIYRTNNLGTPIASGVSGAPTGDLGVTVLAILDSGIINLTAGSITNVPVSGILTQNVTINTGERIRYHVSAAKIGTGGGNVTFGVYYGSSYNSYYDVPVAITTDAVLNKSTVASVTNTDALNALNTGKQNKFIINVKDYGATGNGTTDDSSFINAAVAALPASGGVLYFPNGTYHTLTGITINRSNFSMIGEGMPNVASNLQSLSGGTIIKGGVKIEGNNVTVKNIGSDFGIDYSNAYKSGAGGDGFVIYQASQTSLIQNINIENVIGLCRIGNNLDANAAYHAVLIQSVKYGSAKNVKGVGGWYGVVLKVSDFNADGLSSLENDTAGVYLKSNTYGTVSRVNINNVSVVNNTSRGFSGFLIQSSDADLNLVTASNINVFDGVYGVNIEAEGSNTANGISLSNVSVKNSDVGISVSGPVSGLVCDNITVFKPNGEGFLTRSNILSTHPKDFTLSNIRVFPSATTANAVYVQDNNTSSILSNINVLSETNSIITGSIINLVDNSVINSYKGTLRRNGTQAEYQRIRGGDVTTSLSNLSQKATLKIDTADPFQSIGFGYFNSGEVFMQAYDSNSNTSKKLWLNPFGGQVNINNLSGGTDALIEADSSGNLKRSTSSIPTSGSYTPTVSGTVNCSAVTVSSASNYIRVGDIITVSVRFSLTETVALTDTQFRITLVSNRATSTGRGPVGNVTVRNGTDVLPIGVTLLDNANNSSVLVSYKSGAVASNVSGVISFQYSVLD